jgi:3-deoxy-D-manno-octulosonate 8-phosphate phosphatase KdsC-like HAD superfamily phosphatase
MQRLRRLWWRHRQRLPTISVVVLDVDGVLTDGGLWHGPEGELTKRFDVRDGLGIRVQPDQIAFVDDDVNDLSVQGPCGAAASGRQ